MKRVYHFVLPFLLLLLKQSSGFQAVHLLPVPTTGASSQCLFSTQTNAVEETRDGDSLRIRPFNSTTDLEPLKIICQSVFRGTDYLPAEARLYEEDPACDFQVLVVESSQETLLVLLAVANLRSLSPQIGWLEAVRTNQEHRNQGYATRLISTMLLEQKDRRPQLKQRYKKIMACTIRSNTAMQRVFERVGMQQSAVIRMSDFRTIAKLPGYRIKEAGVPCQHLLDALGMTPQIPKEAKQQCWEPILDTASLQQQLEQVSLNNSGVMPGVWKVMSPETPLLQESLQFGLVYSLRRPGSHSNADTTTSEAIMALVRDKPMPSLKSSWVLCLAGANETHLYAALWHACFSKRIQETLLQHNTLTANVSEEKGGGDEESAVGFMVAIDGRIISLKTGVLEAKFPLLEEATMVYSTPVS
ncbi:expressed unknown protein [Seminavis robusta]|uniref:N-acetyltransferase domain-containing protein n=1 Tax=Seminavis robusta TaxID=568900 RepID=A0A9N8DDC8_9STRA|nr:expressed unknown protein [Seminavis robusta]|eukprot:Sro42_g025730.1 n/a (415) ;mRNA; r:104269-105513